MSRHRRWVVVWMWAALSLTSRVGWAELPPSLAIHLAPTDCPSREELASALGRLLPRTQLVFEAQNAKGRLKISDLGASYRVELDGRERVIEDPEHRCPERARTTAVFVFLTLEPPSMNVPEPTAKTAKKPLSIQLQIGALFQAAPRSGPNNSLFVGGGELRLAIGARNFAAVLAAGGTSPAEMRFSSIPPGKVRLIQIPFDIGVRAFLERGRFFGAIDLSLAIAASIYDALGVPGGIQRSRLDLGVRLGILAARQWGRLGGFLGIHAVVYPRPYDLFVAPQGRLGSSPILWIGATAGVLWNIQ
jgi:hypothetical protein